MKKTIFLIALLISSISFAQTNEGFNYKALLTNNGNPVANAIISVKLTLKQGSSTKWQETHTGVHTDANGIFSVTIGEGTRNAGAASFDLIGWTDGMTLKVEVSDGGSYTTLVNDEPLKYVPYAKNGAYLKGTAVYLGRQAGAATSSDNRYNVGVGEHSVESGTSADYTTAIGYYALSDITTGSHNVAIGDSAGVGVDTGSGNVFIGSGTGNFTNLSNKLYIDNHRTSSPLIYGDFNENYIKINGELYGQNSGDANMIPIMYGMIRGTSGEVIVGASSSGFTCTKIAGIDGKYKITMTNEAALSNGEYIVLATVYASNNSARIATVRPDTGEFTIIINDYDNVYQNENFNFIVYKK